MIFTSHGHQFNNPTAIFTTKSEIGSDAQGANWCGASIIYSQTKWFGRCMPAKLPNLDEKKSLDFPKPLRVGHRCDIEGMYSIERGDSLHWMYRALLKKERPFITPASHVPLNRLAAILQAGYESCFI